MTRSPMHRNHSSERNDPNCCQIRMQLGPKYCAKPGYAVTKCS